MFLILTEEHPYYSARTHQVIVNMDNVISIHTVVIDSNAIGLTRIERVDGTAMYVKETPKYIFEMITKGGQTT